MTKKTDLFRPLIYRISIYFTGIFILISCKPITTAIATENITPAPTQVTLPALPAIYQSQFLNPLDPPHTYVEDTCQYLRSKWHPSNAKPGTVVMIIMFKEISNPLEFTKIMVELQDQGFKAINTKQFLAFMERNIKIPPRSVLLIQDGVFETRNFDKNFRSYWEELGWPVVNGWVSEPDLSESVWVENIDLENEGWVDHQAQGVISDTILSDESSKAVITRELEDSLNAFAERYGKTPYAFIWPNGGFGLRPAQAARQLGYQLGFTSNPRGPVMYNWVPLANKVDPARPEYMPEGPINDPLMTLPRYPSDQALAAIDAVRASGEEAAAYAEASKAAEFNYYDIVCRPSHSPIPVP
ncbi:MAG: hypothetical protein HY863_11700 [Chloroflexi bacterium]|nr:hypothetical protein [Chloroflexota bacterium]